MENNKFLAKRYLNCLESKLWGSSIDRISMSLFNSKIKLTPHQIDAALFAFKSPLNKWVLLADEVWLWKTIEAWIVIAQLRFERKAKILIISPASLIRQWNMELYDKFSLESEIMDRKNFNQYIRKWYANPFTAAWNIIICSYNFASANKDLLHDADFDTVVIDEAHKLRNIYTDNAVISKNIRYAVDRFKRILLTATPIQNSLMDLYWISTFIDSNIFWDKNIFRKKYIKEFEENKDDLRTRLKTFMHRTLRNQVTQYIRYTNRIAKTFFFEHTDEEREIYKMLQDLIQNPEAHPYIIPRKQSKLLLLILTRLMWSSVAALSWTLEMIFKRLILIKEWVVEDNNILEYLEIDELVDELDDEDVVSEVRQEIWEDKKIDAEVLDKEIQFISDFLEKTKSVDHESKYYSLVDSLNYSFDHLKRIWANEKVIIFTSSRRTQDFLYKSLKEGWFTDILMFNWSNNDEESRRIYEEWIAMPENADKINNNRWTNMRSAILEKFKRDGKILISTESWAEWLNLQFCSLEINYDLPRNPQVLEQRIWRCHRFWQKFDVTIINFINQSNKVEQRIYELLSIKFNIFNEIFWASDSILWSLDEVENIEKSIAQIYQQCRTEDEIDKAFDDLQQQYSVDIEESLSRTKQEVIDNFEEDLQKYFIDTLTNTKKKIGYIEHIFRNLCKCVLWETAEYDDENYILKIKEMWVYQLSSQNSEDEYIDLNMNTALWQYVINEVKKINEKYWTMYFDISNYKSKLTEIEKMKWKKWILTFNKYTIKSFEDEEYLFFSGMTDEWEFLDDETIQKMFRLSVSEQYNNWISDELLDKINDNVDINCKKIFNISSEKNNSYLNDEIVKINKWADDKVEAVELKVELMREQRKELRKQSDLCSNSKEKLKIEEEISKLTEKISKHWMELSENEEFVEQERKKMIESIRKESMKSSELETIFTVYFEII